MRSINTQQPALERVFRRMEHKLVELEPKLSRAMEQRFGPPSRRARQYTPAEQLAHFKRLTIAEFIQLAQMLGPEGTTNYLRQMHVLFAGRRGSQ